MPTTALVLLAAAVLARLLVLALVLVRVLLTVPVPGESARAAHGTSAPAGGHERNGQVLLQRV